MKKTISLFMVVAMLLGIVITAIPSSAANAVNIEYVDAKYFAAEPTVDGYISTAEWGDSTFEVDAYDVATKDDTTPYSRFLYWRTGSIDDFRGISYTVWLRWNENYFWVGVKVNDPDGHSLKNGTFDTWNGDAVQFRVDKEGANAVTAGDDFEVNAEHTKPWGNDKIVPDFVAGYVEIAGGFSELWENTTNKGMTSFSRNPLGDAKVVVAPAGSSYSSDTASGITTYEIAIPWSYIFNGDADLLSLTYSQYKPGKRGNIKGGIGRELGMSMVVLDNGVNADATWDAFLAWGSGICGAHQIEGAKSATGSNSVTLVEDKVTPAGYTKYDPTSLLDAKFSQENIDKPNVFYDYLAGDIYKTTPVKYEDLDCLTYDDPGDLSVWGAKEYKGSISNIGGDHGNVLDYSKFYGKDESSAATDSQTYLDTRDGTMSYTFPTSYTFEFDIKYNDTVVIAPAYESAIYNWFGGSTVFAFQCGYFFNDGMFKIVNTNDSTQVLASKAYNLKKDNWYNWKFQFDNESCNARLWIDDLSTTADNADSPWGTMIFNTCWRYFYYSSEEALTNGTLLLFRMMNTQVQYDNVKIYNFASLKNIAPPAETDGGLTGDGGNTVVPVEKEDTNNISIEGAIKGENGLWTLPVMVREEYLSATKLHYNLTLANAKLERIEGLNEDDYTIEDLGNGEYVITITNLAVFDNLKAGDEFFKLVVQADNDKLEAKDIFKVFTDTYTYVTYGSNTGDGLGYIVLATLVATLGCAVIVIRRRENA